MCWCYAAAFGQRVVIRVVPRELLVPVGDGEVIFLGFAAVTAAQALKRAWYRFVFFGLTTTLKRAWLWFCILRAHHNAKASVVRPKNTKHQIGSTEVRKTIKEGLTTFEVLTQLHVDHGGELI